MSQAQLARTPAVSSEEARLAKEEQERRERNKKKKDAKKNSKKKSKQALLLNSGTNGSTNGSNGATNVGTPLTFHLIRLLGRTDPALFFNCRRTMSRTMRT